MEAGIFLGTSFEGAVNENRGLLGAVTGCEALAGDTAVKLDVAVLGCTSVGVNRPVVFAADLSADDAVADASLLGRDTAEGNTSFGRVAVSLAGAGSLSPLASAEFVLDVFAAGEASRLDEGLRPKLKRLANTEFGNLSFGCSGTPANAGTISSASSLAEKLRDLRPAVA